MVRSSGCMSGLGFELQAIKTPRSKFLLFLEKHPFWPCKLNVHETSEELTDTATLQSQFNFFHCFQTF